MRVPELRDLYLDTLLRGAAIASAPGSVDSPARGGWLEQEVLRAYQQIRQAAREDGFTPFSNEEFEEDVQRLIEFARTRSAVVVAEARRSR